MLLDDSINNRNVKRSAPCVEYRSMFCRSPVTDGRPITSNEIPALCRDCASLGHDKWQRLRVESSRLLYHPVLTTGVILICNPAKRWVFRNYSRGKTIKTPCLVELEAHTQVLTCLTTSLVQLGRGPEFTSRQVYVIVPRLYKIAI